MVKDFQEKASRMLNSTAREKRQDSMSSGLHCWNWYQLLLVLCIKRHKYAIRFSMSTNLFYRPCCPLSASLKNPWPFTACPGLWPSAFLCFLIVTPSCCWPACLIPDLVFVWLSRSCEPLSSLCLLNSYLTASACSLMLSPSGCRCE